MYVCMYVSICAGKPEKRSVRVDAGASTRPRTTVFARGKEPYADM